MTFGRPAKSLDELRKPNIPRPKVKVPMKNPYQIGAAFPEEDARAVVDYADAHEITAAEALRCLVRIGLKQEGA